jgi:uncharacterized protein involved in cysteine biosynthesis
MNFFKEAMLGVLIPVRGVSILSSNASIRRLALLPFIVTLLIFIAGLSWGLPFVTGLVQPTTTWVLKFLALKSTTDTYSILSWAIPVLLWPPFVFFLLYMLWQTTRLFAAPLYSLLAEKVLTVSGFYPTEKFQLFGWARANVQMAIVSIMRTFSFALFGAVLFLLSFIPGVGIFTSLCFLLIVTCDVCDYAFEAMRWPLGARFRFFREHFGFIAGFSVTLAVVFLIPGLNFFLLPAAVVGATDVISKISGPSSERVVQR